MREDPDDHRQLLDGGDDLHVAATLRAVFEVQVEHALEQARPAYARRHAVRVVGRIIAGFLRWAGTIAARNPALGASTPWKRIRCRRGRGTSAARRCMNSRGDITMCVVPLRERLLSCSTTSPAPSRLSRLLAIAGHHD